MKVFITGVAGFLGSHVADAMLALGHEVWGNDNMIGGEMANVPKGVNFLQDDCRYVGTMADGMQGAELVYHCAALAYEGLSVFSPSTVVDSIVGSSTSVFSAAIQCGVKRIVHCSSMARYGTGSPPFQEQDRCRPQDPYGIAKLAAEDILKNLCAVHGVEYVIAVPHNIIGPRQKYDDPFRNVASIMMNRMLQKKQPIIYGFGNQMRCFSYVGDCIDCLIKMGFLQSVAGHTINIGPDEQPVTVNQLAEVIADVTAFSPLKPIYMSGRPQEVKIALCSSNKAREMLGYETKTPLREALARMCFWMVRSGPREFKYHLPIEIQSDLTPKTWSDRIF